jgi:hypothetical protein
VVCGGRNVASGSRVCAGDDGDCASCGNAAARVQMELGTLSTVMGKQEENRYHIQSSEFESIRPEGYV